MAPNRTLRGVLARNDSDPRVWVKMHIVHDALQSFSGPLFTYPPLWPISMSTAGQPKPIAKLADLGLDF